MIFPFDRIKLYIEFYLGMHKIERKYKRKFFESYNLENELKREFEYIILCDKLIKSAKEIDKKKGVRRARFNKFIKRVSREKKIS